MFKLRVQAWINVTRIIPTSCYPAHKMRTHTPTLISRFLNFSNQLLLNTKWSCERENEGTEYKFLPSGIRAASAPPDLLQHMRYLRGDPSRQLPATAWVSHRISAVGTEGRPWSPLVDKDGITAVSVSKRSQPVWDGSLPGLWSASVTWNPNQGPTCPGQAGSLPQKWCFCHFEKHYPYRFQIGSSRRLWWISNRVMLNGLHFY